MQGMVSSNGPPAWFCHDSFILGESQISPSPQEFLKSLCLSQDQLSTLSYSMGAAALQVPCLTNFLYIS